MITPYMVRKLTNGDMHFAADMARGNTVSTLQDGIQERSRAKAENEYKFKTRGIHRITRAIRLCRL